MAQEQRTRGGRVVIGRGSILYYGENVNTLKVYTDKLSNVHLDRNTCEKSYEKENCSWGKVKFVYMKFLDTLQAYEGYTGYRKHLRYNEI